MVRPRYILARLPGPRCHGPLWRDRRSGRAELGKVYRRAINKGLYKILSKTGISTLASYRGALFEIVGLHQEVVDLCFTGTPSRVQGLDFESLERRQREIAGVAWTPAGPRRPVGFSSTSTGASITPSIPTSSRPCILRSTAGIWERHRAFADPVDSPPTGRPARPAGSAPGPRPRPPDEVQPAEAILKRFDSAAMSLGALSPEAHMALAEAMNRLGGRSNSGEGGEDPPRLGSIRRSKIKQVASGRFGVTPEYLVDAEVLQIKIAQGAKPGEGGQLPGHKCSEMIARLRYCKPGNAADRRRPTTISAPSRIWRSSSSI